MRHRAYIISVAMFASMVARHAGTDISTSFSGVPNGATFVRAWYDERTQCLAVVFEHESFNVVREGKIIEKADLVCEDVYEGYTRANEFKAEVG